MAREWPEQIRRLWFLLLGYYGSRTKACYGAAKVLEQRAQSGERINAVGGALWIDYGAKGVHSSKLCPLVIDKACGSPATGRNWNSVLQISKMIEDRE